MIKLSVIVPVRNAEDLIGDCLKSISWADEIIVADDSSEDKTVEIAKKYKKVRIINVSGSFSDRRNQAVKKAKGKWFLIVDADERVSPSLRNEIDQLVNKSINQYYAYAIPRRNFILGREMKYGGWWPDYAKRLFRKNKFKKWVGELHEEPVFSSRGRSVSGGEGELGHIKNPLIHLKHDNLEEMVEKTNEWSEIEARLMHQANHPSMNIFRFAAAMLREFWLRMVKHRAFLDGTEGIIYALYQVWSKFISYAKLWEMQLEKSKFKVQNAK